MSLNLAPLTPWIRRSLLLGGVLLTAIAQTGCAYPYPYPVGVVQVREPVYRHAPAPYGGFHGHRGHGERGGRW